MPISQMLWVGRKRVFSLIRTTDQDNPSTTYAQDNQLGFYTESGQVYTFEHIFHWTAQTFNNDLKYTHSGDTTLFYATAQRTTQTDDTPASQLSNLTDTQAINTSFISITQTASSVDRGMAHVRGLLVVGTNGGIFVPEWRQSSGATGVHRMYAGSMLRGIDWAP